MRHEASLPKSVKLAVGQLCRCCSDPSTGAGTPDREMAVSTSTLCCNKLCLSGSPVQPRAALIAKRAATTAAGRRSFATAAVALCSREKETERDMKLADGDLACGWGAAGVRSASASVVDDACRCGLLLDCDRDALGSKLSRLVRASGGPPANLTGTCDVRVPSSCPQWLHCITGSSRGVACSSCALFSLSLFFFLILILILILLGRSSVQIGVSNPNPNPNPNP